MHPLAPSTPPPDLMSSYGTNDEIFLSPDQINHGSRIRNHVIEDNPYQYDPSNLPDGAWFLVRKIEEKETKHGLWRAKGPASEIFANSAIIVWGTTFEFFQVQAAIEQRPVWMMQEYKVTPKGQHDQTKSQESALCRFFSSSNDPQLELKDDPELLQLLGLFGSVNSGTSRKDGQRSIGEPQVNNQTEGAGSSLVDKSRDQAVKDKVAEIDFILQGDYLALDDLDDKVSEMDCILRGDYLALDDLDDEVAEMDCILRGDYLALDDLDDKVADMDCILRGDYLALDDLADAASHSSSSENSSCQSFKSDEYFDHLALLAELDDDKKEDLSGKGSTSNHSIMMCRIANDVVVQPAPLGFLVKESENAAAKETQQASNNNKFKSPSEPSPEQAAKKLKAERLDEGPSHACRATTSSSSSDEPGRAARREEKRSKKLMKYLCFMPF